ncbi:hypothetical protein PpBr36_06906 [Pyricularia pennisetigena]|uniref:hypothetical protein n=1 Tax=Pyricularia pennisetigena TaxID=1578925 RepID=UPI00114F421B|nr:hypothetical protein PpBr36_06906 [Pyricularia pennisetigena]TLS25367.1 hypothetical protein PpBr36_06906 [Pyricularia pennisetigena]
MAPPNVLNIAGRVYSITGGASGIGLATAHLLAREGAAAIWIADVQTDLFDKVRAELNDTNKDTKIYLDKIDVGDSAQVDQWVQRIVEESGGIHGSANVAGGGDPMPPMGGEVPALLSLTDDAWRRIFRLNADGTMYCTRAQVRAMVKMDKGSHPAIVNVGSIASLVPGAGGYAYGASKVACDYFSQNVAKDIFPTGLRINCVLPGMTLTPLLQSTMGPNPAEKFQGNTAIDASKMSLISAEDVARTIVWLMSEHSLTVNGASVTVGQGRP